VRVAYIAGCDGAHSRVREAAGIGFAGGSYDRLFYVADVGASGPVVNGELHVDLDAVDLLAIFAMKGDGHVRMVGTVRATGNAGGEPSFDDVATRPIEQLRLNIASLNWFSTYHVHHRVATKPGRVAGGTGVAGSRLWRTAGRPAGDLRRTRAAAPHVSVECRRE
jgi:2-polyprenyl-6-methoxyphenol hydroxylase-like FAD-dependent oxidoreductase